MARKILLADDSVTAQNMGRKILTDAGYEVIAVNNGSAALKKIAELKPEVAILDVYMPGYSGLEVCQRLKESPDAARIPVLLSVGKLEPFKPEEAQRVRAEGYIVKPFEASELLSALAKVEDKIVPRAEVSKQGRFARAIAAVEEADRAVETPGSGDGWQSRIARPQPKKDIEEEEKVADDSSIYNNVNRDLRTVVETPAEKLAAQEERRQEVAKTAEFNVDVAAVAPEGVPKDVTPQEIAAIAAAAAQIKMAAAIDEEYRGAETGTSDSVMPEVVVPAEVASPVVPELASSGSVPEEEKVSEPATMAGAVEAIVIPAASESRWTAVPVALDDEEASVSLEQEMQKAYASFGAGVLDSSLPERCQPDSSKDQTTQVQAGADQLLPQVEPALAEPFRAEAEAAVTPIAHSEPVLPSQPAVAVAEAASLLEGGLSSSVATGSAAEESIHVADAVSVPIFESAPEIPVSEIKAPVTLEAAPEVMAAAVERSAEETVEPPQESLSRVDIVHAAEETPAARDSYFSIREPIASQNEPAPPVDAGMLEATPTEPASTSSNSFAPIVRDVQTTPTTAPEPELDPETIKSTAAAWASWHEIREASQSGDAASVQSSDAVAKAISEVGGSGQQVPAGDPAPLPATNAMAVAAGAEQTPQEASSVPSNGDPLEVASIVDSLLADLRPKLMEEISRKMAQKK